MISWFSLKTEKSFSQRVRFLDYIRLADSARNDSLIV
jgi:hypothetical protein